MPLLTCSLSSDYLQYLVEDNLILHEELREMLSQTLQLLASRASVPHQPPALDIRLPVTSLAQLMELEDSLQDVAFKEALVIHLCFSANIVIRLIPDVHMLYMYMPGTTVLWPN